MKNTETSFLVTKLLKENCIVNIESERKNKNCSKLRLQCSLPSSQTEFLKWLIVKEQCV